MFVHVHASDCCVCGALQYFPNDWTQVSDVAKAFIDSLLVVNPTERLTAAEALKYARPTLVEVVPCG